MTSKYSVTHGQNGIVRSLQSGKIVQGHRIAWGSNYTFLVDIKTQEENYIRAVYKPKKGECPLYDFPNGSLYKREYGSFLLSQALGWPNIPPTVIREGPYGIGSLQLYINSKPDVTYFDLLEHRMAELERFAVFDLLVNNADRKAGHCLLDSGGQIWSIDHGLTFNRNFKVRTVMLDFWGSTISDSILVDLTTLRSSLEIPSPLLTALANVLDHNELEALNSRLGFLLEQPVIPELDPNRHIPWPWI